MISAQPSAAIMAKRKNNSAPTAEREKNATEQLVSAQWEGPLPPPSTLADFNNIVENGAERIVRMAEKEQDHRIHIDTASLDATRRDFRRGHIIGGSLAALSIAGSVYTAIIGAHPTVSIALVSLPVTALIGRIIKK